MPALELDKTVIRQNPNLVAYYRFESGALTTDSKGSNTLTNNGTITSGTGIFGGDADLGTSNSTKYFTGGDNMLQNAGANVSFSLWVKIRTEISSGSYCLFEQRHTVTASTSMRKMLFYDYNGGSRRIRLLLDNGVVAVECLHSITLGTTDWYHIVFTLEGTTSSSPIRKYVNGSLVYTGVWNNSSSTVGWGNSTNIGRTNDGASYASAEIDDFAVFKESLTPEQVKELYEGRSVGEFQPQPNLVALYHLSDTTDYSGNSYHLTNNNSVAFSSDAKFFKCANFGTANTNKNLSISNALGIDGTAITMSCWVKLNTEITTGTYELVASQNATSRVAFLIWYNYNAGNRQLAFYRLKQNVEFQGPAYTITLGTTRWYHLVITYDLTNVRGYVNGQLVGSSSASGSGSGTVTTYTNIGGSSGYYSNALVDEVAIFNRALSQQEIARYYQWSLGRFAEIL